MSARLHAAGIASVLAAYTPKVTVVGCQPENSCVMADSVRAGTIITSSSSPTLSEGTAGTPDSLASLVGQQWLSIARQGIKCKSLARPRQLPNA